MLETEPASVPMNSATAPFKEQINNAHAPVQSVIPVQPAPSHATSVVTDDVAEDQIHVQQHAPQPTTIVTSPFVSPDDASWLDGVAQAVMEDYLSDFDSVTVTWPLALSDPILFKDKNGVVVLKITRDGRVHDKYTPADGASNDNVSALLCHFWNCANTFKEINATYFVDAGKICQETEQGIKEWKNKELKAEWENKPIHEKNNKGKHTQVNPIPKWTKSDGRRKSKVVFSPGAVPQVEVINRWKGWKYDNEPPTTTYLAEILLFVFAILCNCNVAVYWHLTYWLAMLVQKPQECPRIALLLLAIKGVGKSIFLDKLLGPIIGAHYLKVVGVQAARDRFNSDLETTCLLFIDECTTWHDNPKETTFMNSIVTAPDILVEAKHANRKKVQSHLHVIIAGEETKCQAPMDHDERRYLVLLCNDKKKGDELYYTRLVKCMESESGRAAFLQFLQGIDISNFSPSNLPNTKAMRDYYIQNNKALVWWMDCLNKKTIVHCSRASIKGDANAIYVVKSDLLEALKPEGLAKNKQDLTTVLQQFLPSFATKEVAGSAKVALILESKFPRTTANAYLIIGGWDAMKQYLEKRYPILVLKEFNEDAWVLDYLMKHGYREREYTKTESGNCQFESVANEIGNITSAELRARVVQWLRPNANFLVCL